MLIVLWHLNNVLVYSDSAAAFEQRICYMLTVLWHLNNVLVFSVQIAEIREIAEIFHSCTNPIFLE